MKQSKKHAVALLLWYLPIALVQLISGIVTKDEINPWYQTLQKASWNPPPWVFGPTWTLLYFMMAFAAWVTYLSKTSQKMRSIAYTLFFSQLIVNGLWSFLFFRFHMIGWALTDLGLLTVLVTLTGFYFYRIRPLAGLLLLPYLLWSLYAFSLNAAIWWLN